MNPSSEGGYGNLWEKSESPPAKAPSARVVEVSLAQQIVSGYRWREVQGFVVGRWADFGSSDKENKINRSISK